VGLVYRPDDPRSNRNGMIESFLAKPRIQTFGRAPYVISDHMSDTRHMADGKTYNSKSEFRKATKAAGCIEVGNETADLLKPRPPVKLDRRKRRDDIARAVQQVREAAPKRRRKRRS
jgi:hypothetical protein